MTLDEDEMMAGEGSADTCVLLLFDAPWRPDLDDWFGSPGTLWMGAPTGACGMEGIFRSSVWCCLAHYRSELHATGLLSRTGALQSDQETTKTETVCYKVPGSASREYATAMSTFVTNTSHSQNANDAETQTEFRRKEVMTWELSIASDKESLISRDPPHAKSGELLIVACQFDSIHSPVSSLKEWKVLQKQK